MQWSISFPESNLVLAFCFEESQEREVPHHIDTSNICSLFIYLFIYLFIMIIIIIIIVSTYTHVRRFIINNIFVRAPLLVIIIRTVHMYVKPF